MSGRINTRPYVIRCNDCHLTASRLSRTPFIHLKLPLWMLGWVLEQSIIKYPQVLTGAEIKRQLNITEEAALRLKKRIQVFASQQKGTVESLFYSELQNRFGHKRRLPQPDPNNIDKLITKRLKGKPVPQSDSVVLFSARERSNKGRKRFRHHGQTASIYLSDSLGGKQVGVMVQTTTWKGGPALYESIPNQQIKTLLPIIEKQIPKDVPFFTDMGMDWYKPHNKNHRVVNHNLASKRGNGKSRRRFQQNGIHTQAAEGRQGALKTAFRSYRYIKPKYSQLYLNEYSFLGALKYFGVDSLVAKGMGISGYKLGKSDDVGGWGMAGMNVAQKSLAFENQKQKFFYNPLTLDERKELSPRSKILKSNKALLEALGDTNPKLEQALLDFEAFYKADTITHRRRREKLYAYTAEKLWSLISGEGYAELTELCREHQLPKRLCHRIVYRWAHLGIAEVVDRTQMSVDSKELIFDIRRKMPTLPHVLYMTTASNHAAALAEWKTGISHHYPNNTEKQQRREYERRWFNN